MWFNICSAGEKDQRKTTMEVWSSNQRLSEIYYSLLHVSVWRVLFCLLFILTYI